MTHADLIDGLAKVFSDALKDVRLPSELEKRAQINIFKQYLPRNLFEETSYYPLVMAEWLTTQDDLKAGSLATVGITTGIYSEKENWYLDAFHIMEILRLRLLTERVIGEKFRLTGEIVWQTPETQPAPFFFVTATAQYQMFLPQEKQLGITN